MPSAISVSIADNLIVVGAYNDDDAGTRSGSAYVFRSLDDGANWTQIEKLTASDGAAEDRFGFSAAIAGNLIVVGATGDENKTGAAYTFAIPASTPSPDGGGGDGGGCGDCLTTVEIIGIVVACVAFVVFVFIIVISLKKRCWGLCKKTTPGEINTPEAAPAAPADPPPTEAKDDDHAGEQADANRPDERNSHGATSDDTTSSDSHDIVPYDENELGGQLPNTHVPKQAVPRPEPTPRPPLTPADYEQKIDGDNDGEQGTEVDSETDQSPPPPPPPPLSPPVVLIVTTAVTEMEAVLERLEKVSEGYPKAVGSIPVKIGKLGGRVVAVCKTEQGINDTYGVVDDLLRSDYLRDSVKLVFAVGFAWGAKPESGGGNQRTGDVLVATKSFEAGHNRAGDDGTEMRGEVKTSPLVNSVNSLLCKDWPPESQTHFGTTPIPVHPRRPKAHVGTVISLPTLFDGATSVKKLLTHPDIARHKPIGGDMELYQIVKVSNERGKRWLLAKSICDFAGLEGKIDKIDQPLAAAAAADFAVWLLKHEVLDNHLDLGVYVPFSCLLS